MRLYFVDNQWLDYDTIHNNYGYTKTPTEDISSFRDAQEETWGELLEGVNGFYSDLEVVHYYRGTYFVQNYTGWHTLNELSYQCNLMPSEAETEGLIFTNGTELSKAARLLINPFPGTDIESYKYLVQKRIDLGWLTEDELREYGWSKYNPEPPVVETPDYYILDATTGAVLHSISSPLSNAKPSVVTIGGNVEHIDNPPTPQMEILLGIRWDYTIWGAHAFNYSPSDNQWWSGVLSEEDRQRLVDFGLSVSRASTGAAGQIGAIVWDDNYTFEPLAFYADLEGTQENQFDLSKFECIQQTRTNPDGYNVTFMMIWYDGYSSTLNTTWRCRITKNS